MSDEERTLKLVRPLVLALMAEGAFSARLSVAVDTSGGCPFLAPGTGPSASSARTLRSSGAELRHVSG